MRVSGKCLKLLQRRSDPRDRSGFPGISHPQYHVVIYDNRTSALSIDSPSATRKAAKRCGNERLLLFQEEQEEKEAIDLASDNGIAILGVESLRIEEGRSRVENYTRRAFDFVLDWPDYVKQNNRTALKFTSDNPVGDGYGYILTMASRSEFEALGSKG